MLGGENLSFQTYFGFYFEAAGDTSPLPVAAGPHPFLPASSILAGPGSTIHYEPDPATVALLGYRRGDVRLMVWRIIAAERELLEGSDDGRTHQAAGCA